MSALSTLPTPEACGEATVHVLGLTGGHTARGRRPNDFGILLRATMPAEHAVCDLDVDSASNKCSIDGVACHT
jgi:hypothetical protein